MGMVSFRYVCWPVAVATVLRLWVGQNLDTEGSNQLGEADRVGRHGIGQSQFWAGFPADATNWSGSAGDTTTTILPGPTSET